MRDLFKTFFSTGVRRGHRSVVKNVNHSHHHQYALIVYITHPFEHSDQTTSHQNQWQVVELARIVGGFGFNVDVVDYTSTQEEGLETSYDVIIDLHPRQQNVYDAHMGKNTKTIAYITGSNPEFSNQAEQERLKNLFNRRHHALKQRRYVEPFDKNRLEACDLVLFMGNEKNFATYSSFNFKQCKLIQNTSIPVTAYNPTTKNPKKFLFLGGAGQVHKGLDLLLEVFPHLPDMDLYVCSRYLSEKDFCKEYKKELFQTKNIHPMKFLNFTNPRFQHIASQCTYLLLPSCSEGMAGSILAGMSFGLIPLTSEWVGFDPPEVQLLDLEVRTLGSQLSEFSRKPQQWIDATTKVVLELSNTKYSRDTYSKTISEILTDFFTKHP